MVLQQCQDRRPDYRQGVRLTAYFARAQENAPRFDSGGVFLSVYCEGPAGTGSPGNGPLVGAAPTGAPLPPATPAMSAMGAPATPPRAISGAPAGTAAGSGAPAGIGAPAGNGSPPGMGAPAGIGAPTGSGAPPAMSAIGAPAATQPAPAPPAPAAPAAPAAAGAATPPADPYMHAPPPVFMGAAATAGLSAIAAPQSPTPATTLMLNRSVIDVNSLSRLGGCQQIHTGAATAPGRASYGQLIFNRPTCNAHYAAPHCFQIETFHPVYWTSNHVLVTGFPGKRSSTIVSSGRNPHQSLGFDS
jgi:hypothetical protein